MKKIKNSAKKVLPMLLVVTLLMTSMFITTSAESSTAVTTAPNTQICSINNFTQDNFNTYFKVWSGKTQNTSFDGGVLKVVGNSSNTRNAAYMVQTATWNQYVTMTVKPNDKQAITPVLWLRAYEFDRVSPAGDNIVPLGYCVKAAMNNNYVTIRLCKSWVDDSNAFKGDGTSLAEIQNIPMTTSAGELMSLQLEATIDYDTTAQTNVIKVNIYRFKDGGAPTLWDIICVEDSESELLHEGWAGFAVTGSSTDPLNITSFAYHSTDDNLEKILYATSSFGDYMDNTTAWANNTHSSVVDGKLVITGNTEGTDRNSARFLNKSGENLKVSATVKTPHYFDGDTAVRSANSAVIWLKAISFMRNGDTPTPVGYYIKTTYNASNDNVQVRLFKQTHNGPTLQGATVLSTPNPINIDSKAYNKNQYFDISYDATVTYNPDTNANDIEVKVYKGTSLSKTITVSDSDENLFGPGTPGLGANNADCTFVTI